MNVTGLDLVTANQNTPEFRMGSILSRSIGMLGQNFFSFSMICGIALIPVLYLAFEMAADSDNTLLYTVYDIAWELLAASVCQAIVVLLVFQHMRGKPIRVGDAIRRGISRFVPIVATSCIVTVVVLLGTLLLFIPGIIARTAFSVALPVCIVEGLGPVASMSRSAQLTRFYRGGIFGTFLAVGIVNLIVGGLIGAIFRHPNTAVVFAIALYVWVVVLTSLIAVVTAVMYYDLRVVKEGIDIEQIAAVFD